MDLLALSLARARNTSKYSRFGSFSPCLIESSRDLKIKCAESSGVTKNNIFDRKVWLLIGLPNSCSISVPTSGTCQKFITKYHD